MQYDRRMTIVELEQDAGISHGSIHAILPNDLKMRLVSAKFVPCGFCITMTHPATHRLLCSNSSPRKAFLSSPNHRTLWISLRVTFGCSLFWKYASRGRVSHHGGHRIECDGWTPEDSKRRFPPVHPTMAGSMKQVCVCAQGSDFEGDYISVVIYPTITVLYHNSGNFVTAPRTVPPCHTEKNWTEELYWNTNEVREHSTLMLHNNVLHVYGLS